MTDLNPASNTQPMAAVAAPADDRVTQANRIIKAVQAEIGKAVIGQTRIIEETLIALLAGGHVLIEGVPGLGKTLLVKALAARPGMVKSRDQLIDAAYGENIYVDDRTIDSHIKRVRKKFRAMDDNFDHIETLYGIGYKYKDQ